MECHPQSGRKSEATALHSGEGKKPFSFYMSLLCLGLVARIVAWDTTALSVAIPVIATQLQATTLEAFFASTAFTLAVAISQPIYLSISDAIGRKIPLYAAMVLFTVGSILFAIAQSIMVVFTGRLIQGLGGYASTRHSRPAKNILTLNVDSGGLDILQEIIIVDMTSLKERPMYLALMALPIAVGSIMGPVIGALLCQFVTWRWLGWCAKKRQTASSIMYNLTRDKQDQFALRWPSHTSRAAVYAPSAY